MHLLTVDRVIKELALDPESNRRIIAGGIQEVEQVEAEVSIGHTIYSKMLAAKNNFTSTVYDSTTLYSIGDYVTFQDLTAYESLAAQQDVAPTPANIQAGLWRAAKIFDDTPCGVKYELVWDMYLARYLSTKVMQNIAVTSTVKLSGTGLSRSGADYQSTATADDMKLVTSQWAARGRAIFNAMQLFVKRDGSTCYHDFKFYTKTQPAKQRNTNKKMTITRFRF